MSHRILVNLKCDEDVIKLIGFLKGRKKGDFFTEAVNRFLENTPEEEIEKFVNPLFEKECKKILKKIKSNSKGETNKEEAISSTTIEKAIPKKESDDFEKDEF